VSTSDGTVQFEFGGESCLGRISADGLLRITAYTKYVGGFICSGGKPMPHLLKIDLERAEYDVLTGATRVLLQAKPKLSS
jgi:hypothetical protein